MYTPNIQRKIISGPTAHEFSPLRGWYQHGAAWHRMYTCITGGAIRRAVIQRAGSRWTFSVSEFSHIGVISVARCALDMQPSTVTACMRAADDAACAIYEKVASCKFPVASERVASKCGTEFSLQLETRN